MSNIKVFDFSAWDSQSLESSSGEPAWPNGNTKTRWKTQVWKATGDTAEYVRTTGSSSLQINGVFVINGNVTSSGTVTLKGSDDNWVSTPTSEAMTRSTDGTMYVYFPPSPLNRDDWGIYVADPTNPDGYISLGRVWLGTYYYEEDVGYSPNVKQWTEHNTIELEASGGQVSLLEKPDFEKFTLPFDLIKNKTRYNTCISRIGKKKEFFILRKPKGYIDLDYPTPEDYSYYVRMLKHTESPVAGTYHQAVWELQEER
jgi:hypothetical protein